MIGKHVMACMYEIDMSGTFLKQVLLQIKQSKTRLYNI